MFILDSLMVSGIRWVLDTVVTAAEAEMNDDAALREQLLEAEMRRETGEITDAEFRGIESELLARIREIKERREGTGPFALGGGEPMEVTSDSRFQVEASVSGDFHEPATAPHTSVVESTPTSGRAVELLDMEPGDTEPQSEPGLPLSSRSDRSGRSARSDRSNRSKATEITETGSQFAAARARSRAPTARAKSDRPAAARTRTTRTRTSRTNRTARTSRTKR